MADPCAVASITLLAVLQKAGEMARDGVFGNRMDAIATGVFRNVLQRLDDDPGRLPRNHDLVMAVRDSLREAGFFFLAHVAQQIAPDLSLPELIKRNWKEGRREALFLDHRPELAVLSRFEKLLADDEALDGLSGIFAAKTEYLLSFVEAPKDSQTVFFNSEYAQWACDRLGRESLPADMEKWLREGWFPKADGARIDIFQVFCLFFREKIKSREAVERILNAQVLWLLNERLSGEAGARGELLTAVQASVKQEIELGLSEVSRSLDTLAAQDGQLALILQEMREFRQGLDTIHAIKKDTALLVEKLAADECPFPNVKGISLLRPPVQRVAEGLARFSYDQEVDAFVGREDILRELKASFLALPGHPANDFRWHVILGAAGVGKSRLGLTLARLAGGMGWKAAGFLNPAALDHAWQWRPDAPTFLVVDYAVSKNSVPVNGSYTGLQMLFGAMAEAQAMGTLRHPVRILLLERQTNSGHINEIVDGCANRNAVKACLHSAEPALLTPLGRSDCISIMRGRMGAQCGSVADELLDNALVAVDPRRSPLFAALLGAELANRLGSGGSIPVSAEESHIERRRTLLNGIIEFERSSWRRIARDRYGTKAEADKMLDAHELLLALCTMTRGMSPDDLHRHRAALDRLSLPNPGTFDPALYARMSDGILPTDEARLPPLEPDLIGELHAEQVLARFPRKRAALVDLAWQISASGASLFATLSEIDYGSIDADPTRYLPTPGMLDPASAAIVAQAFASIARVNAYRTCKAFPSTAPPWEIGTLDELEFKRSLRNEFEKHRQEGAGPGLSMREM